MQQGRGLQETNRNYSLKIGECSVSTVKKRLADFHLVIHQLLVEIRLHVLRGLGALPHRSSSWPI